MKILFVAMSDSVHTARWISQIADEGHELHLFPSYDLGTVRKDLRNITVHHSFYAKNSLSFGSNTVGRGLIVSSPALAKLCRGLINNLLPDYRVNQLVRLINELKPDIIHSLEFQGAGYLTARAKQKIKRNFPYWITTCWGSDLHYFGRFPMHMAKIKQVLMGCDGYLCESRRDAELAKSFGFKKEIFPILPGAGGFDLAEIKKLRRRASSLRNLILVKGYQGWAGRANIAIAAIAKCASLLTGKEIMMYSSVESSRVAAVQLEKETGVHIKIVPEGTGHTEIMRLQALARFSIGLSITDGVPNSMLEAMAMGSLPIQSFTSCADEWIEDGVNGLLVPPEDVAAVEKAIRRALVDDALLEAAAFVNERIVKERLDENKIRPQVVKLYTHAGKKNKERE